MLFGFKHFSFTQFDQTEKKTQIYKFTTMHFSQVFIKIFLFFLNNKL